MAPIQFTRADLQRLAEFGPNRKWEHVVSIWKERQQHFCDMGLSHYYIRLVDPASGRIVATIDCQKEHK